MKIIHEMFRNQTTTGFRKAVKNVYREFRILRIHRRNLRTAAKYANHQDIQLHLACGRRIKDGWVNIDLSSPTADIHLDLRERLPFKDSTVAIIYSEHFFEHLSYPEEVQQFLSECIRILKPGGLFCVGVPDTEPCCKNYADGNVEAFRAAQERWHPKWCDTMMHSVNYHFRQGEEHKYAYDFETLAKVLSSAGFTNIIRRPWDAGRDAPRWEDGTLYVDAHKPSPSEISS
jgi:predicted SAM-dependent methyltransferase